MGKPIIRPAEFMTDGTVHIPLTKGQYAIVDAEYAYLATDAWYAWENRPGEFYAMRTVRVSGEKLHIRMHRLILELALGRTLNAAELADHINGNRLDNRVSNLRPADHLGNSRNQRRRFDNTSGHPGVTWDKANNKWRAFIQVKGSMKNLGRFSLLEDACRARHYAETQYFGEFVRKEEE